MHLTPSSLVASFGLTRWFNELGLPYLVYHALLTEVIDYYLLRLVRKLVLCGVVLPFM